jgi:hypothetical protein
MASWHHYSSIMMYNVVYKSHEQPQCAASLQMVWNCYTQDRIVLMISSAKDLGRNSIDEKAGIRAPGNISSATT